MEKDKFYFAGAIIALLAIFPLPSGFYFFIRISLCLILLFIIYDLYQSNIRFWIFSAPLAILYNPIIPIYLHSKPIWVFFNISTSVVIMYSFFLKKDSEKKIKSFSEETNQYNNNDEIKKVVSGSIQETTENFYEQNVKKKQTKETSKLVKIIHKIITQQFILAGFADNIQKPDNDYIVGYIIGYCDGYLIHHSIDNNSAEGFSIPSLVLIQLYGSEKGASLFSKFLDTQLSMTYVMQDGREAGYNDALDLLEIQLNPTKLQKYLNQIGTSTHETNASLSQFEVNQAHALSMLISSFIMQGSGSLLGQFVSKGSMNIEDIPKDNWIIGYICGFAGAQLIDWQRNKDINFSTIFTNEVLVNIYRKNINFKDFIYLFDKKDEMTIEGFNIGGNDYEIWKNKGEEKIITELTNYIFKKKYLKKNK